MNKRVLAGAAFAVLALGGLPVLTTSTHFTDNVIRVGVNYRFGGPVVAKY
jgi:hypothetical protein